MKIFEINIDGVIGNAKYADGDMYYGYAELKSDLQRFNEFPYDIIVVNIRSTGGLTDEAILIYESLMAVQVPIITRCYGYVASAATVIAQAGDVREMSDSGLYLIHNSIKTIEGNKYDFVRHGDMLDKVDNVIANIYTKNGTKPAEEYAELMAMDDGNGVWLTLADAIEWGLVDCINGGTDINKFFNGTVE